MAAGVVLAFVVYAVRLPAVVRLQGKQFILALGQRLERVLLWKVQYVAELLLERLILCRVILVECRA